MTLTEFLLARIAEDEAAASRAVGTQWQEDGGNIILSGHPTRLVVDWAYDDNGEHISRWDPDRVLAECAAKIALLNLHNETLEHRCPTLDGSEYFGYLHGWAEEQEHPQYCPVVRQLAAVYADHPDYRTEWAP